MEDLNANYDVRLFWGEKKIYCHENCEHLYEHDMENAHCEYFNKDLSHDSPHDFKPCDECLEQLEEAVYE